MPFYDRTGLIHETLGTLSDALLQQILVTVIVVLVMLLHLRGALVISAILPLAVPATFVLMKVFGVDSNVVALAGIAIAIGTIVDMGIIITENTLRHLREAPEDEPRLEVVLRATHEVSGAILTAMTTTVISFLPVFAMTGAEGKMFAPLAYTKTFALLGAVVIALVVVPAAVHQLVARRSRPWPWPARLERARPPAGVASWTVNVVAILAVGWVLTVVWEPLGPERGLLRNALFILLLVGGILGFFLLFLRFYGAILSWCLDHKVAFLAMPLVLGLLGANVWLGFEKVFSFVPATAQRLGADPQSVRGSAYWAHATHALFRCCIAWSRRSS